MSLLENTEGGLNFIKLEDDSSISFKTITDFN